MPRLDTFLLTLPFFHRVSDRQIRHLYAIRIIQEILNKFTLFFLPIFLFFLGKDTAILDFLPVSDFQRGMVLIALYYSISRVIIFFTAIPLGHLMLRGRFDTSLLIAYLLRVVVFAALYFSSQYPYLIFIAAVLEGLFSNFFWNSFFTVLTRSISKESKGKELGVFQFFSQLIAALSPAVSGYLAYNYGFEVLFLVGIVLSILSAIFTTNLNIRISQDEVSWSEFKAWLKLPSFISASGSFAGRYLNDTILFLWPLYIFLFLGSLDKVGFLYTLSLFLALVVAFFMGSYIDRIKGSRKPFYFSGGALSLLWLARTQLFTIWGFAFLDTFERLFSNFHWLFYDVLFITGGQGDQAFSYFVYREMIISSVAIIFWVSFSILFILTDSWTGLFIFGGIGVLLSLLITRQHNEKDPTISTRL